MKKLLVLALTFALSATVPAPTLATPAAKTGPAQILTAVFTKEYKTPGGQVVMTVHAEVPVLSGGPSKTAVESVNAHYREMTKYYFASLEKEYFQDAIADTDRLKRLGVNYGFYKSFQITYNANGLLSVFIDNNYDLTGAHPTSKFHGETFDLRTGKKLTLDDILPDVSAIMPKLFKKVDAYLKENGLTEFAQTGGNSLEGHYNQNDFILTSQGIRFFFQQYSIAPYVEGIPSFDLTYKELGALLIPAKDAKDNAAENELREKIPYLLDRNFLAARDMFISGTLETVQTADGLLEVRDARFGTYQAFKNYLSTIYTGQCVDQLLKGSWYINNGGKLYVESAKVIIKSLNGDQSSYTYSLSNMTKTKAMLTVYLADKAGVQRQLNVPLKKEDGEWRMEAMMQ